MVTEPESMEQLVYHTLRSNEKGSIRAWVYKGKCPECGKGLMGKPVDAKTGKPKIRSKEYVCPECAHQAEKVEYEETLECEIQYTCPECGAKGEATEPFKWKTFQGIKSIKFVCDKCKAKLAVTKKMKEKKDKD
jgi:uncharacterized CHY-type Zn-finger protein